MARQEFTFTKGLNPKGQAELILKGAGLGLFKPKFYRLDVDKISEEQQPEDTMGVTGNLSGTPVFDAVVFKNPGGNFTLGQFNTSDSQTTSGQITEDDLVLPIALITATQEKNIVRTKIQGRNGTVKEYISDDDWQINIKGVLVGDNSNKRPVDELKKLDKFRSSPMALDIISNFLDDLKVYTVVITSVSYEQREGMRNVYDFNINCYSDEPFELKLNA